MPLIIKLIQKITCLLLLMSCNSRAFVCTFLVKSKYVAVPKHMLYVQKSSLKIVRRVSIFSGLLVPTPMYLEHGFEFDSSAEIVISGRK